MLGGKAFLRRRDQFRTTKTMEIAAIAGQKILCSVRLSMMPCSPAAGGKAKTINGPINAEYAHAKIGTIMHASIFGVEDLARPSPMGRIEALDMLVLDWRELHRNVFCFPTSCPERALEIGIRHGFTSAFFSCSVVAVRSFWSRAGTVSA